MRQQIKHGAMIDAATPDEVAEAFRTFLRDNVRKDREEYRIEKGAVLLDGGGNGQLTFRAPRSYNWFAERITATGGASTTVTFYENTAGQGSDLRENITLDTNGRYSDSFSNDLFIPAGSTLFVVFAGAAGAGLNGTVNMQIRMVEVK